jgi:hypothetical protein
MKKPTLRSIRSAVLALLLLGAMFAALNSSGTFTKLAFAQNYGGGGGSCPAPSGCGNWGCHVDGTGHNVCTLYNIPPSTNCSGTRTCS